MKRSQAKVVGKDSGKGVLLQQHRRAAGGRWLDATAGNCSVAFDGTRTYTWNMTAGAPAGRATAGAGGRAGAAWGAGAAGAAAGPATAVPATCSKMCYMMMMCCLYILYPVRHP
jgi:hypothetical protein